MSVTLNELAARAFALPTADRVRLVDLLLDSFLHDNAARAGSATHETDSDRLQMPSGAAAPARCAQCSSERRMEPSADHTEVKMVDNPTLPVDVVAPLPARPPALTSAPATGRVHGHVRNQAWLWPIRGLDIRARWYDELCVRSDSAARGTMQRAGLQLNLLKLGCGLLEENMSCHLAMTLSFGTIERCLDQVTDTIEANHLSSHRLAIVTRGQMNRMRSPYRVRGFLDWLRAQRIPVGYRLTASRVSMEMTTIDFVQPDFAKLQAPQSQQLEPWQDMHLEARAAGLDTDWLVVSGLDTAEQIRLAAAAGFRLGQGRAIKPGHPPRLRRPNNGCGEGEAASNLCGPPPVSAAPSTSALCG
jgi:hypothetical protein